MNPTRVITGTTYLIQVSKATADGPYWDDDLEYVARQAALERAKTLAGTYRKVRVIVKEFVTEQTTIEIWEEGEQTTNVYP